MEFSNLPPPSAISRHSTIRGTPDDIGGWLTSLRQDSPASPSPSQGSDAGPMISATCGPRQSQPFVRYDRDSRSWKTSQPSLVPSELLYIEPLMKVEFIQLKNGKSKCVHLSRYKLPYHPTSDEYLETWPKVGTMQDGACLERTMLGLRIAAKDFGYWPTPNAGDGVRGARQPDGRRGLLLTDCVKTGKPMWPTPSARDWRSGKASQETMDKNSRPLNEVVVRGGTSTRRTYPTPNATDGSKAPKCFARGNLSLPQTIKEMEKEWPTPTANRRSGLQSHGKNAILGQLNPAWVEWLQGVPIGSTALEPLAICRFRSWLQLHGGCYRRD